jgi:DHA1 family inner membrane transport protein
VDQPVAHAFYSSSIIIPRLYPGDPFSPVILYRDSVPDDGLRLFHDPLVAHQVKQPSPPRSDAGMTRNVAVFTIIRIVMTTLHRMVYPFLTVLARGVGVDLIAMSYALTARSLVGVVCPFAATLADTRRRRFGMLLGIGVFTASASVVIFWPVFPGLVISIVLSTLGRYIFDSSMQAYLGDRIPYAHRGRMVAVTEFAWSLAFIVGIPLVGFIISRNGWMAPFPLLVFMGAIIFLCLLWMLPKDIKPLGASRLRDTFKLILGSIPALAGLALALFVCAGNEVVNFVFGVWLEDSFGLQIAALGIASAVIGFSELAGEGLVAAFVDRLGKPRAIGLGLAANCLAALVLPLLGSTQVGALVGLSFFYLTFELTTVSILPFMTEIMPAARGTLMAFNIAAFSLGRALGDLLAPRLYTSGFWLIMLGAVGFNLLALVALQKAKVATG